MIQPPLVPPHPPPPKGGYVTHMQPCIGITICLYWFMYVCLCVCLSVCWYVSMCVSQQGRHVIVFVSAHKDTTCTHNVPAPPPVGGLGGSYHLQPCIGITICFYWFMYDNYLFVLIYGCLYVCIYVSKQGRHVIVVVSAHKDTTCTHNVPAPPCGWVGGVLPSVYMYRYNYMFLLIYVW